MIETRLDRLAPFDDIDADRGVIHLGNLKVDRNTYQVFVAGQIIHSSFQEFELLTLLAAHPNRILPFETITRSLWKESGRSYVRRLNVAVLRLRAKLEQSRPYRIQTVRGRGYGLVDGAEPEPILREAGVETAQRPS